MYFADCIFIIWFDISIKNVVKFISHCCFFTAFHTASCNYRLILGLLDVHDQINFLLSPLLEILENVILFAFFLHLGVTIVALTKHQKFGQCKNQSNVLGYIILIWWILWPVSNSKGLKARVKNLPPLENTWRNCTCQESPCHFLQSCKNYWWYGSQQLVSISQALKYWEGRHVCLLDVEPEAFHKSIDEKFNVSFFLPKNIHCR